MKNKILSAICLGLTVSLLSGCSETAMEIPQTSQVEIEPAIKPVEDTTNEDTDGAETKENDDKESSENNSGPGTDASEESKESKEDESEVSDKKEGEGNVAEISVGENGMSGFNGQLIDYLNKNGFGEENYMVSPASYRAALALAVAGADGETRDELIKAMGFNDMDEVNTWYNGVLEAVENFQNSKAPMGDFTILNSIWNNTSNVGNFEEAYVKYVQEHYGAEANAASSAEITDKVNKWVEKNTRGLIPTIADDLSDKTAVLVNTVYLKTAWFNEFEDFMTEEGDFTTITGDKVKKDFMYQTHRYSYYEDEKGKLVVIPMFGNIDAIFVLGEIDDVKAAIEKATTTEVEVKLPKLDLDSEFGTEQLVGFLKDSGAQLPFDKTGNADFSIMCSDTNWYISDIIQKTHLNMNEQGIEATAATAVIMALGTAMPDESLPKQFYADQPFKFMLCESNEARECFFYGQIVK